MIIELLTVQLRESNATVAGLNATVADLQRTIADLRNTIAGLGAMLKERDDSLSKAKFQMRGLKSTFLPKKSEKQALAKEA